MPLQDVPRHPLLFGPSPVQRLDRSVLYAHLGGQPTLDAYASLFSQEGGPR